MAVTGREASDAPGQVGAKLVGRQPETTAEMRRPSTQVPWAHGILIGGLRGLVERAENEGPAASVAHFAAAPWSGDATMHAALGLAPEPCNRQEDALAVGLLHKGVYTAVTGVVYDGLPPVATA